jgi:hypothetical protein
MHRVEIAPVDEMIIRAHRQRATLAANVLNSRPAVQTSVYCTGG